MNPLDLILAPTEESFIHAARPLVRERAALTDILPELLRETALRHYRPEYPKHMPHALLTLLGGMESRELLTGPERAWPVVQALSYVRTEKHSPPFPFESVSSRGDADDLASAIAAGDVDAALGAARALLAAGAGDRVRDTLFAAAAGDRFNLCHRLIYTARVFFRLDRSPDLDAEALLFPVIHYFCLAPTDHAHGDLLAELAPQPTGGGDPLSGTCARRIMSTVEAGDPRETAKMIGNVLRRGSAPADVLDVIFLAAVRRLTKADGIDWVRMAHVATFADSAGYMATTAAPEERARAPYLAALFLTDLLAEIGPAAIEDPPHLDLPTSDLAARLETAVEARDETTALAAALALDASPGGRTALEKALLLACARVDGAVAFGHDVKVAAAAVRVARESRVPGVSSALARVATYLARLPEGSSIARALFAS